MNLTNRQISDKAKECFSRLLTGKLTLSCAESCSGGLISATFTSIPGSSAVFKGGVIAYSNEIKNSLLNVSNKTLSKFGAVSKPTAEEMVKGAIKLFKTDISISTTGIAGPSGGTPQAPIGTVFISVSFKSKHLTRKFLFSGNRRQIQKQAVFEGIKLILQQI